MSRLFYIFYLLCSFLCAGSVCAELIVRSSADEDSNRASSFIFVPENQVIPQGIKHNSKTSPIPPQIPFTVQLTDTLGEQDKLQWEVRTMDKAIGRIKVLSPFKGEYIKIKPGRLWRSEALDTSIKQRSTLIFKPVPQTHQPAVYKKGRSKFDTRRKYGGGTTEYNDYLYNPRMAYTVTAKIINTGKTIKEYQATLRQDDKDLLRQEYINHYNRPRYGYGENGNIPVPRRNELTKVQEQQSVLAGAAFSQSVYGVMIEDGVIDLAQKINEALLQHKQQLRQDPASFVDLNGDPLPVSDNKPWLSSGWRNPERNEWYSNAINGIHQRGAAIDLIPNEQPGTRESAASYWLLWKTLNDKQFKLTGFWQLEALGRPMKTSEYKQDIQPKNGIPDAFDLADHLHIQLEAFDE